jgi:hypothetical protein
MVRNSIESVGGGSFAFGICMPSARRRLMVGMLISVRRWTIGTALDDASLKPSRIPPGVMPCFMDSSRSALVGHNLDSQPPKLSNGP